MKLQNVTLEMSLKPFTDMSDATIGAVCADLFRQWSPLIRHAEAVSVLLWTADGSEILDYRGAMSDELEWARYIGHPNPREELARDSAKKALHSRAYLYRENPPVITYGDLRNIVAKLKKVGRLTTNKPVRVGATFDPGGEFARSPFKYEKHNEICLGGTMGRGSFVCCYATLNADSERYAGFPHGIAQDTPFGTFLGRQSRHFLRDLGFDYLWFSNGFGFGMETWKATGPLFDGKQFLPEGAPQIRAQILEFWRAFRAQCPDFPIETRGTNLVTGSDLASNALPLRDIYNGDFNMKPPPNSPWAALNGDFGLELAGYMSRIAELPPDKGFPFRYYVHDPWWLNSPWLDRYGREPHDIYLPLSVGRVDAAGRVQNPDSLSILTADDSYGRMPDKVPNEVIPHLLQAMEHAPDAPGPLVWVYPFDEYHDMVFAQSRLAEPFSGDWLMRAAINNGLPLNTVVSSRNFLANRAGIYRESVLLTPVPDAGSPLEEALLRHAERGGRVLLYGPILRAGAELLAALNLRCAAPLCGEMELQLNLCADELTDQEYPTRLRHLEAMSAGGLEAILADENEARTHIAATVTHGSERRVAALWREMPEGGIFGWVRGTHSQSYQSGHLLTPDDPTEWFHGDLLLRFLLESFGYGIGFGKRRPAQRNPVTSIARHDNGFFFSGYTPDTRVELRLRFSQGAPIFTGCDADLQNGAACYRMPRAWHRECRVFVRQNTGEVSCAEQFSGEIGITRRLALSGLENATVCFYPQRSVAGPVTMLAHPQFPYIEGDFLNYRAEGDALVADNVIGPLWISW